MVRTLTLPPLEVGLFISNEIFSSYPIYSDDLLSFLIYIHGWGYLLLLFYEQQEIFRLTCEEHYIKIEG